MENPLNVPGSNAYPVVDNGILIPKGKTSVTVDVQPPADALVEGNETVILMLVPSDGYETGSPGSALIVITDYVR